MSSSSAARWRRGARADGWRALRNATSFAHGEASATAGLLLTRAFHADRGEARTKVLAPDTLAAVCERCHNERMGIFPDVPQKAKVVLLLLRESKDFLAADERLYRPAKGTAQARSLSEARTALYSARLDWHRFDLDTITGHLQDFYDAVKKLSAGKRKR